MQRYLFVLHAAVALAPYVVADEEYGRKRYGMLGQLVNQGRALARYQTTCGSLTRYATDVWRGRAEPWTQPDPALLR